MQYTYDEFDAKCDSMEKLFENFPTKPYFPSDADISRMEANLDRYYDFIVYLTTNNPIPSTPEEVSCMKKLNDIIKNNTQFIDDPEDDSADSAEVPEK